MKAKLFQLFLLVFIFSTTGFSQTQTPSEILNEFWNLALKNDVQTAKEKYFLPTVSQEFLEKLKSHFNNVSTNQLKITNLSPRDVSFISAFLTFKAKSKDNKETNFYLYLLKNGEKWRILNFGPLTDTTGKYVPNLYTSIPFKPFADKFKSLDNYNEKSNPIQFQKIYPENY